MSAAAADTRKESSRTPHYSGPAHTSSTVAAGTVGNVLEWYDFALYGYFAPILSGLFFPSGDHLASLIATFGVFAAGFFMRPLGGMIFGHIGDRFGRGVVLRVSIVTMGTATFLLGTLPTYQQVGMWGALALVLVRLLQGMSVGGEFSGSVTYMVETSPLHKRGFSGSWANVGSLAGTLLGSGLAALDTSLLPTDIVHSWGWRIPFLLGGLFGAVAYWYVRRVGTTPHMEHHEQQHQEDSPLREALTRNRRQTILAVLFTSGYGVFFYIPLVYLPTYASEFGRVSNNVALQINSLGTAVAIPMIPLFGWLSDHLLRRRTFLMLAFGTTVGAAWVLLWLAGETTPDLLIAQLLFAVLIAVPLGVGPAMLVELFPMADRLTGYSVAYNLGLGVAGGTAPMIATWLVKVTGSDLAPAGYLALACLVSVGALWAMQDRSREPLR